MNDFLQSDTVKVFAKTIEDDAVSQIKKISNSKIGENAHIRIMPDAHSGVGCVIGTTMKITDKVCPNLVGVDIGCGVDLIRTDCDFKDKLEKLDNTIRETVPCGMTIHGDKVLPEEYFQKLLCWEHLNEATRECATRSLGTLGGGNHFIEAYEDGYLSVHSGSRNIGYKVAEYYQKLAEKRCQKEAKEEFHKRLLEIPPKERQRFFEENKKEIYIDKELSYLTGDDMSAYLHDIEIMQSFARDNRMAILASITKKLGIDSVELIASSTHNYIDIDEMILRKGAISAKKGEVLVIPMNMRDGILICEGKGNQDWNYSAPHGAGRLYSRTQAKAFFTVEEYKDSMQGVFSTCISENTLDEAPFAYKDFSEICELITPTVTIKERKKPIFNFKAGE